MRSVVQITSESERGESICLKQSVARYKTNCFSTRWKRVWDFS